MKRAIVTGATGFVGANLARRLLQRGDEVHVLVRPGYQTWRLESVLSEIQVHVVDVSDAEAVAATFTNVQPEWVFHLAAHGAYHHQTDVRQMVATNLLGTIDVLSSALAVGVEAFVAAGTSSEYGPKDHAPSEYEPLEPNSDYAITKAAATLHCMSAARRAGANVSVLRLYSAYGPWEEPTRLIPSLASYGLAGSLPPLASPEIARDFVYVDDVVEAFLSAASHTSDQGAVYNIGTGTMTTLADAVSVVRDALSIAAEPMWRSMDDRDWDTTIWVSDNRLAGKALGWHPRTSFERGFTTFVGWLKDNPDVAHRYRVI